MRKEEIWLLGSFLLVTFSLIGEVPNRIAEETRETGQPVDRRKFYAVSILSGKEVLNSRDALGASDGSYAEITPGGQLAVLMAQKFIDYGTLITKGENDYRLEGFFRMQDTGDVQKDFAWVLFWNGGVQVPGMWPGGFRFESGLPGHSVYGGVGVDTIRIINVGNSSLFVDAVIGYGGETEKHNGR